MPAARGGLLGAPQLHLQHPRCSIHIAFPSASPRHPHCGWSFSQPLTLVARAGDFWPRTTAHSPPAPRAPPATYP